MLATPLTIAGTRTSGAPVRTQNGNYIFNMKRNSLSWVRKHAEL